MAMLKWHDSHKIALVMLKFNRHLKHQVFRSVYARNVCKLPLLLLTQPVPMNYSGYRANFRGPYLFSWLTIESWIKFITCHAKKTFMIYTNLYGRQVY